ncbi:16S rRNA (cytosine(1402)-N(4))-methyltransferase [Actinoplanes sp. ATCC 53533]|uniref:class I SAM-dependent methyltransferase n=1 Tax=Actinoplanes sp. ATCC 53533 TaxID=1288362 RepID=UPI000F78A727|nr:class I SAM-dependent methyltransferase [Actinoplanes sp. ATCC 53533]RSM71659.1 16S rRNA (cytosine(1402)-N(4))-methyltransferase [Actinoplanes sp. ATCC 53533]
MNRVESALINSAPRRLLQRLYEVPQLRRFGGPLPAGARALEIGCGPGYGAQLILERFGAATLDAVDLDPAMIARAQRRLRPYGDRVTLRVGDAADLTASLGAADGSYDAVFDFAIIHHIPAWRDAVAEVARVLRRGGTFYFDEVTARALARPSYRALFDHPTGDRFNAQQFVQACETVGLDVGDRCMTRIGGDYLLGAARRR